MLVTDERKKMFNALIYFSENVTKPGKTKLFKLLNFLDFSHFKKPVDLSLGSNTLLGRKGRSLPICIRNGKILLLNLYSTILRKRFLLVSILGKRFTRVMNLIKIYFQNTN